MKSPCQTIMTISGDPFERAMKKTLIKVTRVLSNAESMSGSFKEVNYDEDFDKISDFAVPSNNESSKGTPEDVIDADNNENRVSDFSYAAAALQEIESIRKMDLRENINDRLRKIASVEQHLRKTMQNKFNLMKQKSDIKNKLFLKIEDENINDDLIISQKFSELRKRYSDLKSQYKKEHLDKQTDALKAKQDEEMRTERQNAIRDMFVEHSNILEGIIERVKQEKNEDKLEVAGSEMDRIEELSDKLTDLVDIAKNSNFESDDHVEAFRALFEQVKITTKEFYNKLDNACQEETRIEEIPRSNVEQMDEVVSEKAVRQEVQAEHEPEGSATNEYVHPEILDEYTKLDEHLNEISKQADVLIKNPDWKYFTRQLKIAINTPINALSSVSSTHMQDKFFKISHLLRGNFRYSVPNAPDVPREHYFPFLIDFLSKRFINQGENLVPSKSEDAFLLASLIIAIWIEFPEVKPVLLAHFMKKCPYLIPAYWPQYKGLSEKDFYISRGYQYKEDGTIEQQSIFLKRMTGIFMLYVAITVIDARHNQPHPHGLKNAWKWLAAVINLEPRPDITAALLHTFLELAGHKLSRFYGLQFWKVIHLLNSVYLRKIEEVASNDFRGPVSRLKDFVEKVIRNRQFQEPRGILPADYW